MASDSKKSITFSVETPEEKQRLTRIAIAQGFQTPGAMARRALVEMLNRRGWKDPGEEA